jgi:hypothetical protein
MWKISPCILAQNPQINMAETRHGAAKASAGAAIVLGETIR